MSAPIEGIHSVWIIDEWDADSGVSRFDEIIKMNPRAKKFPLRSLWSCGEPVTER